MFLIQSAVCFGLISFYTAYAPEKLVSNQTVFLAFYRSPFLHSLIPMGEVFLWLRNVFLIAALGCAAAHFSFIQRKRKFPVSLIVMLMVTIVFFSSRNTQIGNLANILCVTFSSCAVMGEIFHTVYRKDEAENE